MDVRDGGLRHADKERLETVVTALQNGGHFAIVVLAREISFSPAGDFLELGLDEPAIATFHLTTDDEVMRMFASPQAHENALVFLRLANVGTSAMAALNLHRDKLRSRPCRFVLWLDGQLGQARFADRAPDCYSVREALAFVEGQKVWHVPINEPMDEAGSGKTALKAIFVDDSPPIALRVRLMSALYAENARKAREILSAIPRHWWTSNKTKFYMAYYDAKLLRHEGHWEEAEAVLQRMLGEVIEGKNLRWVHEYFAELASLLAYRAELDEALRLLNSLPFSHLRLPEKRLRFSVELQCANPDAVEALRGPLADEIRNDSEVFDTLIMARAKVEGIQACIDAGLLPPAQEEVMIAELDRLDADLQTLSTMPVQASIDAAILCADVRLARRGAENEARIHAERALALTRKEVPEMIPLTVRRIAVAMLRTGDDLASLDTLLVEALNTANDNELAAEAVRLHGLRLWLAHGRGEVLNELEEALEASFQRCGSVLVEAEVLYQIGRGMNRPAYLERARRIYRRLPWPAREISCLEALGKTALAQMRCAQFELRLHARILERRTELPPIGPGSDIGAITVT